MAEALKLARNGLYSASPNPRVGCVLVRQGQTVGRGWHMRTGAPHAEVNALSEAGDRSAGATAYVTLEPCSHRGLTPPCADALVEAGVARVVAGMRDPDPRVSGRGLERLRSAGIAVEVGLLETQCRALNRGFISRHERHRPWVTVKLAASLDGRTAMASGESQWITSVSARRDVQRLRARSDAIMTGIGTLLADDPSLNVRLSGKELGCSGEVRQPIRVVLDSEYKSPESATLFSLPGEILIYGIKPQRDCGHGATRVRAARVSVPAVNGRPALDAVMRDLASRGINEVLVEAGATLVGALIEAGLVDELVLYLAPHLMGSRARGLVHLAGVEQMADRIGLEWIDNRMVGQDLRLTARVVRASKAV